LSAGSYTVSTIDNNGCTATAAVVITQPTVLGISTNQTNVICYGGVGAATANLTGGTTPYTYSWNDGGAQATATGLSAGSYTVSTIDNNGCTATAAVVITQPAVLGISTNQTNVSCYGGVGAATANLTGGTTPYIYSWNDGSSQVTSTATGLSAGSYTVSTTDNNGCAATAAIVITQPTVLGISTNQTNVSCYGGAGTATANLTGGTTPYTYSWNDGGAQATATATGLSAGSYTVSTIDNNGCAASASVTLTQPASALGISLSGQVNVNCYGGTGSASTSGASGGTSPYTYLWNDGSRQTNPTASGLSAGSYTIIATDNNGCSATAGAVITQPSALGISITSQTNVSCNGGTGSATANAATGGTTPYTYLWNDGSSQTNLAATGLSAGSYTITATDNTGCSATASAVITQPSILGVSISGQTNVSCFGGTGSATASTATGGASPYTYLWNDGSSQTNLTATGLSAGSYTITTTDNNGCSATAGAVITQPASALGTSLAGQTNVSCHGGTGSATVNQATGGTSPYTYIWNDASSQTNLTATGLLAGSYTVTATDNNGCSATAGAVITQPALLIETIASFTNSTGCLSSPNGTATANTATGGTSPYTYNWTPSGGTNLNATGLSGGTYTITATDANSCTATASVTITQALVLRDSISASTQVTCNGGATGAATVGAKYGLTPYTYAWSNSKTTAAITGLTAGTYTVTVTDHHGCTATASVTLTQPGVVRDSVASITYIACHGGTGSASIGVIGGTTPYTYTWSGGASTNTVATVTNLTAGTYTVTVKDFYDCAHTTVVFTMTQPGALRDSSVVVDDLGVSCNGGNNGSAKIGVKYGTTPYTFVWTPNVSTSATASNLTAGTYSVNITDDNGCTSSTSVSVTQPTAIHDSISSFTQVTCNGGTTGAATVGVKGGTTSYSYLWSNSKTTAAISALSVGTYTVTVTDHHGCTATASATLTQPGVVRDSIVSITEPICHGGRGDATIGVKGGTTPYTYTWSPNVSTTSSGSNLSIGTYTVTVKDKYDCAHTAVTFTITQPELMRDSIATLGNVSCNGDHDGSATVGVKYGATPYTYSWFPNISTTGTITGLSAGTYVLTLYNNNSCSSLVTNVVITQPSALRDSISAITQVACNGGTGSATIGVKDGTSPYSYAWSSGITSTTKTASGLVAGSYTVTITDKHGCGNTVGVNITQPDGIRDSLHSITYPFCHGDKGTATIGLKGGTSPYTYDWSGGITSHAATVTTLTAGTYTVTVKDKNNCANTAVVFTVTQPAAIRDSTILADQVNVTCNGTHTGSAKVGVKYGISPFTYLWDPSFQTTPTATGLSAGTYTVTVSDYNGCSTTTPVETVVITQPTLLTVSVKSQSCSGTHGTGTVAAMGGTTPYTYSWSPGGYSTATVSGLADGTYTVTATDKHGCDATVTITFTCTTAPPRDGDNGTSGDNSSSYQLTNVSLYPNPNTGQFTIAGIEKGMLIEIYDYTGRKISTITASDITMQFNLSNQANGIYLIRILSQDGTVVSQKKVVKTQ